MPHSPSEQPPSKEKLPDWLRRWYALKGELRFREAADEIERLNHCNAQLRAEVEAAHKDTEGWRQEAFQRREQVKAICHALSGTCVMVTDPERQPCTIETCMTMEALARAAQPPRDGQ